LAVVLTVAAEVSAVLVITAVAILLVVDDLTTANMLLWCSYWWVCSVLLLRQRLTRDATSTNHRPYRDASLLPICANVRHTKFAYSSPYKRKRSISLLQDLTNVYIIFLIVSSLLSESDSSYYYCCC